VPFHYLAIEGPIGVGKTRLAERLAQRLEATTILEDTENPFSGDFATTNSLCKPSSLLLNRHRQLTSALVDLFLQTMVCD
jgi:deoxyadenosine/deoxycytidine kinase